MKSQNILRSLMVGVCALALTCSVLLVALQYTQVATPPPQPEYTLTLENGHLAVLDAQGAKLVYDSVYVYLLPESDIDALRAGIPVYSENELRALLEDYGA